MSLSPFSPLPVFSDPKPRSLPQVRVSVPATLEQAIKQFSSSIYCQEMSLHLWWASWSLLTQPKYFTEQKLLFWIAAWYQLHETLLPRSWRTWHFPLLWIRKMSSNPAKATLKSNDGNMINNLKELCFFRIPNSKTKVRHAVLGTWFMWDYLKTQIHCNL